MPGDSFQDTRGRQAEYDRAVEQASTGNTREQKGATATLTALNDFREKKANSITGFKIIDDYTFSIQLINNASIFLEILTNPVASIISEEVYKTQKDK
jgi:ABC-type oligopeptide transport system substrate-binding subunit